MRELRCSDNQDCSSTRARLIRSILCVDNRNDFLLKRDLDNKTRPVIVRMRLILRILSTRQLTILERYGELVWLQPLSFVCGAYLLLES